MFQKTDTNEKVFPQGFISALMETLYLIYQDSEEFLECQIQFFSFFLKIVHQIWCNMTLKRYLKRNKRCKEIKFDSQLTICFLKARN